MTNSRFKARINAIQALTSTVTEADMDDAVGGTLERVWQLIEQLYEALYDAAFHIGHPVFAALDAWKMDIHGDDPVAIAAMRYGGPMPNDKP